MAGVLDRLRDKTPERFEALNEELQRWFWEYDRVLFDVPDSGQRAFSLRTVTGRSIPALHLSQGTLLALAILTLTHLPDPPPLVAFEEPDRGIHPRLLREIQDALYRLAYPQNYGDDRAPVQVIATTHSPYFLDLFKEHPEEIVIAQRRDGEATFERLADLPDIEQILEGASLGEIWYSGILGGVPVGP
ncbi:MAG: AAA family ATPase [Planctomycetales bacterium]